MSEFIQLQDKKGYPIYIKKSEISFVHKGYAENAHGFPLQMVRIGTKDGAVIEAFDITVDEVIERIEKK